MNAEDAEIIDVKCEQAGEDCEPIREPIHKSNRDGSESIHWVTAGDARHKTRLDKTPFQRAMTTLIHEYQIPITYLRRGEARNTQYSSVAIDLIKALKSRDMEAFEELRRKLVPQPVCSLSGEKHAIALTSKVEGLAQKNSIEADSLAAQVRESLARIVQERQASQEISTTLSRTQITAARNRGIAMALQIFASEQEALNEVLAQMRSIGLGE
jgi:hypothetical protein